VSGVLPGELDRLIALIEAPDPQIPLDPAKLKAIDRVRAFLQDQEIRPGPPKLSTPGR